MRKTGDVFARLERWPMYQLTSHGRGAAFVMPTNAKKPPIRRRPTSVIDKRRSILKGARRSGRRQTVIRRTSAPKLMASWRGNCRGACFPRQGGEEEEEEEEEEVERREGGG